MRLRNIRIAVLFSALAIIFIQGIAGATHYPLTIRDTRGKMIRVMREPSRIISTIPSNTEILFSLGLGPKIIGVGKWDDYPAEAKRKPKIGDRTISVEKILSLKPDLVFAHAQLNSDVIPTLERYGIKVIAVDPKTIGATMHDILLFGKVTNRENASKAVVNRIEAAESLVRKRLAGSKQHPKVLVSVQADPLWAAGPGTFVDEMIRIAGGVNVAANAKPGFNQFSAEAAVYRRPDLIIGTTKGDRAVFTHGIWTSTPASRGKRIFEANPDILVRPGPRLANGILEMAKMIHPEIFGKR
jgi:iron complex transport system substrate-binding protein